MATTKKITKKTAKTAEAKGGELVLGRFRPDTDLAKMILVLKDGKARTPAEIQKVVKASVAGNIATGKFMALKRFAAKSKLFTIEKVEGKIQLQLTAAGKKKAA